MRVAIPQTTKDITIEQYSKYIMIANDSDKEFVGHKMLSIFLGVEMKDVLNIPQAEAESIIKDLTDMLDSTPSMEYTFHVDGVEYGFIPDLEELTLGEYVDLEDYIREPKDWNKAAAVMFRPVKQKIRDLYSIEDYKGDKHSQSVAKTFPASCFINATLFFYNLSRHLMANSATYLAKLLKETNKKDYKTFLSEVNSANGGDGLTPSIHYLTEMRQNLLKLLK